MLRGLFVTGTDTSVGKTTVSAALVHRYRHLGSLRYWKPIQTGVEQDDDTAEVKRLGSCADAEIFNQGVRLPHPVSPHLASQLAGKSIDLHSFSALVKGCPESDRWIIEGAGGVLVPINDSELMIDLIRLLGLSILVVARSELGTINHTLLTLASLRSHELSVAGVVMVGEKNNHNRVAIETYGKINVVGEMPYFDPLLVDSLKDWATKELDNEERLLEFLL